MARHGFHSEKQAGQNIHTAGWRRRKKRVQRIVTTERTLPFALGQVDPQTTVLGQFPVCRRGGFREQSL
ncbi:uncharacterized protein METZ01_LOCUS73226 [marine metagenome]|uniref:Uncharacterized protein n=1 Tax=marine metagenome TaxID=408172 RepID=A0A381TWH1_9ZZZZ